MKVSNINSYLLFILVSASLLIFGGCRVSKPPTPPIIIYNTDSIVTKYVEKIVTDTVVITIRVPAESVSQVVKDSTSHLETTVAISNAWLNPDGTLGHNLFNKDIVLSKEVPINHKEVEKDNTSASVKESAKPYPQYIEVERKFTTLEKFKLSSFWYIVCSFISFLIIVYRKSLFSIVYSILKFFV